MCALNDQQLNEFSIKVADVLQERLQGLSLMQKQSLDHALIRVLQDHEGKVSEVTSEEIEGAYEVMLEVALPTYKEFFQHQD